MNNQTTVADSKCSGTALTQQEWFWWMIFILAGLALRWLDLDARPVHHDESLHGMYGIYFFDWPNDKFYRYDPMLHGPLLYNLYPFIYTFLGITEWSIRFPIAALGSIFMFLPFLLRRYMSSTAMLALTAAVALSPTLAYWSRLVHHDLLVLSGWFLMLYGATRSRTQYRPFFIFLGLAIQATVKANVYITAAILIGYLAVEYIFDRVVLREKHPDTLLRRVWSYCLNHPWHLAFGAFIGLLVFIYFYSSGFRYGTSLLGCPVEDKSCHPWWEGFTYWLHNHNIERISGPFLFHFYLLSWYELPVVLALLLQLVLIYRSASKGFRIAGGSVLALAGLFAFAYSGQDVPKAALFGVPVWGFFKLKDALDIFGLIFIPLQAVIITFYHLQRREKALAFFGYFFWANFFSYNYAGEKTPWLSIYALVSLLAYLTLYFDRYLLDFPIKSWREFPVRKLITIAAIATAALGILFILEEPKAGPMQPSPITLNWHWLAAALILGGIALMDSSLEFLSGVNLKVMLFVLLSLYCLRASIMTNFTFAGRASELVSQVHTTHEYDGVVRRIRSEFLAAAEENRPMMLVSGESVWPTVWYMRSLPLRYEAKPEERGNYAYIMQDYKENPTDVPEGFEVRKLKLRGWWVPDFSEMTLKRFLNYSFNHIPWKPRSGGDASGYSYVTLLSKIKK